MFNLSEIFKFNCLSFITIFNIFVFLQSNTVIPMYFLEKSYMVFHEWIKCHFYLLDILLFNEVARGFIRFGASGHIVMLNFEYVFNFSDNVCV